VPAAQPIADSCGVAWIDDFSRVVDRLYAKYVLSRVANAEAPPPVADLTPEQRALRAKAGRLGAYVQQAQNDTRETTRAAREAFDKRFLDEVDPRRELTDAERNRRAAAARKAYFQRLSLKAQAARRAKANRRAKP
jgi:hypothetical protein